MSQAAREILFGSESKSATRSLHPSLEGRVKKSVRVDMAEDMSAASSLVAGAGEV
jgi:hypothetical protein